jgi:CRP-like cAMP-binding protein
MDQEIGVPQTLILAADYVKDGEILNELEFVLYHNVFFQNRKLRVIGTKKQIEAARVILQESFLGPKKEDVAHLGDLEKAGYYEKELEHFRKGLAFFADKTNPERDKSRLPDLEDFVEFAECEVGNNVKLKNNKVVAAEESDFDTIIVHSQRGKWVVSEPAQKRSSAVDTTLFKPVQKPSEEFAREKLDPPDFGVTFLGTSSGFDPTQRTSSFVWWVDGKGILVDPLADPKGALHKHGIDESQVPFIFLTHVHADHDAGVLRLVLNGKRIKLITSRVIYESLLRKLNAMAEASNITEDLSQYIDFIEVKPGETLDGTKLGLTNIKLDISSALHAIPTIRFLAKYDNGSVAKSLFYSADTYYDPEGMKALHQKGILSNNRLQNLLNFGWHAGLIIHEAGMPPIHTPQAALQAKATGLRKRIFLIHTSKTDNETLLPLAEEGITLTEIGRSQATYLEAFANNLLLNRITVGLANDMRRTGRLRTYREGATIIHQGSRGKSFYFIIRGRVNVKVGNQNVAILGDSDYFGEAALLTGQPRNASVQAATHSQILEIPEDILNMLLTEFPHIRDSMLKVLKVRPSLAKVSLLKGVDHATMNRLIDRLTERSYPAGSNILVQGQAGDHLFVITEGKATVTIKNNGQQRKVAELSAGDIFGEIALIENSPRTATIRAATDTKVLVLERKDFKEIVEKTPVLHFGLTRLAHERLRQTGNFPTLK